MDCSAILRSLGSHAGPAARSSLLGRQPAASSVFRSAFTSAVNDGDAVPATGSEEDRETRAATSGADDGPPGRTAADAVGGKARGAADEVKEAGRDVKDQAKQVGQDVKDTIKDTR